jgi:hypothetical protein
MRLKVQVLRTTSAFAKVWQALPRSVVVVNNVEFGNPRRALDQGFERFDRDWRQGQQNLFHRLSPSRVRRRTLLGRCSRDRDKRLELALDGRRNHRRAAGVQRVRKHSSYLIPGARLDGIAAPDLGLSQMRRLRFGRHHDDSGPVGVQRGGELAAQFFGAVDVNRPAAET